MKNILFFPLIISCIIILFSCDNDSSSLDNIKTVEAKRTYLEKIFEKDQYHRLESQEIISKYGYGSTEHLKNEKSINTSDSLNLILIEEYLMKFGYPSKESLGEIAAYTPLAVVHHSGLYEERTRNFNYLLDAYENGDIKESSFIMYLDRMYMIKFGERFAKHENEKDKIQKIIEELGLK